MMELIGEKYNIEDCGWDGGDCEKYPGCRVSDLEVHVAEYELPGNEN